MLGKPSAGLPEKLETEEKARIAVQKKSLGEEGLAEKIKELEEAKKEHERPIPQEMLTSFPVPPVSSINWIPVKGAWNNPQNALSSDKELQTHVEKDNAELPFFVGFHHAKVNLVFISAICLALTVRHSQASLQFQPFCPLWTCHIIFYREFILAATFVSFNSLKFRMCPLVISRSI